MIPRIRRAMIAATALTLMLTACSTPSDSPVLSDPEPTNSPAPEVPVDVEPVTQPDPVSTPEPEAPAAEPTCETIIGPTTIQAMTEYAWTFKENEFQFGRDVVEGGIECVWGDYTVASDHVQIFAWAPLDADASAAAQKKLVSEGWLRAADGDDGHTYITENPPFNPDLNGFGMTYEFGDGWVSMADTKQSLILIEWP